MRGFGAGSAFLLVATASNDNKTVPTRGFPLIRCHRACHNGFIVAMIRAVRIVASFSYIPTARGPRVELVCSPFRIAFRRRR